MFFVSSVFGQSVSITANPSSSINAVVGQSNHHALESIYLDSEIGASNFIGAGNGITRIEFSNNATNTSASLPVTITGYNIYMKNVAATTTTFITGTYSLSGYTLVYSGNFIVNASGSWNGIDLTTPFERTAGSNLQVLLIRNSGTIQSGLSFDCSLGNSVSSTAPSCRRYNSINPPVESSSSLSASTFRAAIN